MMGGALWAVCLEPSLSLTVNLELEVKHNGP
jgi:hypothetical protein